MPAGVDVAVRESRQSRLAPRWRVRRIERHGSTATCCWSGLRRARSPPPGAEIDRRFHPERPNLCYSVTNRRLFPAAERRSSSSIRWLTLPSENSAATRMAFLMALAFERPWQMMQTPRTPSSGAPPYSE